MTPTTVELTPSGSVGRVLPEGPTSAPLHGGPASRVRSRGGHSLRLLTAALLAGVIAFVTGSAVSQTGHTSLGAAGGHHAVHAVGVDAVHHHDLPEDGGHSDSQDHHHHAELEPAVAELTVGSSRPGGARELVAAPTAPEPPGIHTSARPD